MGDAGDLRSVVILQVHVLGFRLCKKRHLRIQLCLLQTFFFFSP